MATATPVSAERRFLLDGVSWQFYETCLAEIGDRPIRLTYRNGSIEMMSPSEEHERFKRLLARLVDAATEELNIPIRSSGSTTWRKQELDAGLEPDNCYYIEHEAQVRGKREVDLDVDPAPDLAIEIEITTSAVNRMAIYAALGVPEVWRFDGQTLSIHGLAEDGAYHRLDRSRNLPLLPPERLVRAVLSRDETDETTWIRAFRQWVREHVVGK